MNSLNTSVAYLNKKYSPTPFKTCTKLFDSSSLFCLHEIFCTHLDYKHYPFPFMTFAMKIAMLGSVYNLNTCLKGGYFYVIMLEFKKFI